MTIHDSDRDFDQFRHFDRPVSPSTATLSTLRHRLVSTSETRAITASSQVGSESSSSAAAPFASWSDAVYRRRMRPWHVAAAILAFLLAASTLVISLQPEEPARLAFQPEPTAERDVNPAGTIGRTWQVGDQNPIVGSPVWSRFSPTTMDQFNNVIVDGSIVVRAYAAEGQSSSLVRLNLSTGEVYWGRSLIPSGIHAANDDYLFAFWRPDIDRSQESQLIAIDIETGDIAWRGPTLADRYSADGTVAVVDGDTVYALDFLGNVVSVDAATGEVNWQFPEQFREPTASEAGQEGGLFLPPRLTLSPDAVFIVRPSQSLVKIDRATGKQAGSIAVMDDYASNAQRVDIAVSDSFVLVMAINPVEQSVSSNSSYWVISTDLLAFDRKTLEFVGRTSIADMRGNTAIQGDTAFVPMSDGDPFNQFDNSWNPRSRVEAIELATMTVASQITGIDGSRNLPLSLAGNTLIVPASGTIGFYEVATLHELDSVTIDLPQSEFDFRSPVLMDGTTPVVVGSIGEIYLLNGPPIAATPETAASPAS